MVGLKYYTLQNISFSNFYFIFYNILDYKDFFALEILLKLLYPRNTKGLFYKQAAVSTN